jgi:hypothetical protein
VPRRSRKERTFRTGLPPRVGAGRPVDAAHLLPCSPGCCAERDCVVPLCRERHRRYDLASSTSYRGSSHASAPSWPMTCGPRGAGLFRSHPTRPRAPQLAVVRARVLSRDTPVHLRRFRSRAAYTTELICSEALGAERYLVTGHLGGQHPRRHQRPEVGLHRRRRPHYPPGHRTVRHSTSRRTHHRSVRAIPEGSCGPTVISLATRLAWSGAYRPVPRRQLNSQSPGAPWHRAVRPLPRPNRGDAAPKPAQEGVPTRGDRDAHETPPSPG